MTQPHIRTIAHTTNFPWEDRGLLEFSDSDKIHLYRDGSGYGIPDVRLKLQPTLEPFGPLYPTDDDLYVRGPAIEPGALRDWVALFVATDEPDDTLVQFRLYDVTGAQDLYWDGGAWSAAGAGDWNTLQEVQTNLGSLDAAVRGLRLVFNLHTDDATATPRVTGAVVLFTAAITSFNEEWLYRTFLRQLSAGAQPIADVAVRWPGGTTYTWDHDAQEEPLGEATLDIVAAYDLNNDPDRETDLLQSYNTGSGLVTLSQSVDADNDVLLLVVYQPVVAILTHPDFDEVAGVPAVTITTIDETLVREDPRTIAAPNVGDANARAVQSPRQVDFDLELTVVVPRGLDLVRVTEAVQTWIRNNPVLLSSATGGRVSVTIQEPFSSTPRGDAAHLHEGTLTVRLWNAEQWIFPAFDAYSAQNLVLSWNP